MVWPALCGFAADRSGLHFMVGAFLSGAVIDSHRFNQKQVDRLREHVLLIVMPVYFLSTGLRTNWTLGGSAVFAFAAVLLAVSVGPASPGLRLVAVVVESVLD